MTYFTILHWIVLILFLLILVLLIIVSKRESNPKIFWSMVFSSTLVIVMLSVFSMFVLDKYTKKAKILRISHRRVLMNETIKFYGTIKNTGKFKIGKCKLEIKIVNNALGSKDLSGTSFYKPRSGLDSIFSSYKSDDRPSTIIKKYTVAKDIGPREIRNFSVTMPYPPYFQKTDIRYKLYCH